MSVLVTGIAGHIGSNAARMLIEAGEAVVGLDLAPPGPHTVLNGMNSDYEFSLGNVADLPRVAEVVKTARITRIIHAAVVQAEHANSRPVEAVRVNIEGTINVLEAARLFEVQRVVCCSSSSAAGEHAGRPLDSPLAETDVDWPMPTVYGLTKHTCEGLVVLYRQLFGLDVIACRPARVWGPGYARWDLAPPIELLVREAASGRAIRWESGGDTRMDYTYVKDIAYALIRALSVERPELAVFNASGGRLVSVFEVIDILRTVYPNVEISVGPGLLAQADPSGGDRSYQLVLRPNLDISAARKQLGYEPVYAIDRGIPAYAAWLRDGNYL